MNKQLIIRKVKIHQGGSNDQIRKVKIHQGGSNDQIT